MTNRLGYGGVLVLLFSFAFLYAPIALLVLYSFNASKLVTVWGGFSTKWYASLLQNDALIAAAWTSLRVGIVSAALRDSVLGTLAALALARRGRFRGRTAFASMLYAPMVMPEVVIGLALLLLFVSIGMERGFWTVVIAHATLGMCFVSVVVYARLARLTALSRRPRWILAPVQSRRSRARHAAADRAIGRGGIPARVHDLAR
jgi:putrescine transport system permease protein